MTGDIYLVIFVRTTLVKASKVVKRIVSTQQPFAIFFTINFVKAKLTESSIHLAEIEFAYSLTESFPMRRRVIEKLLPYEHSFKNIQKSP